MTRPGVGDVPQTYGMGRCNPILSTAVGERLHGCEVTTADHELEGRILAVSALSGAAALRGELVEAKALSQRLKGLLASRRPEIVAALKAAEQEWLDEGLCYFSSGAAHRGSGGEA